MFRNRTVLCVDDDEDDREIVCSVIKDIDPAIKVLHALNGRMAYDMLLQAKTTHEISMPHITGY